MNTYGPCLFCLLALVSPVFAADDEAALATVATRLFALSPTGGIATATETADRRLATQGLRYTNYGVTVGGTLVGTFTRVRARTAGAPDMDVALRLRGGSVTAAVPLQPLVLGTQRIHDLGPCFAPFDGMSAERYGAATAGLFRAMVAVTDFAAGRAVPAPSPSKQSASAPVLTVEQSTPRPGAPCPDFRGISLTGERVSAASFAGRPCIVGVGSTRDAPSLELLEELSTFVDDVGDAVGIVGFYPEPTQYLFERLRSGAPLPGHIVADADGTLRRQFSVPFIPYVLAYDGTHVLQLATPYRGRTRLHVDLAAFRRDHVNPTPSPDRSRANPR